MLHAKKNNAAARYLQKSAGSRLRELDDEQELGIARLCQIAASTAEPVRRPALLGRAVELHVAARLGLDPNDDEYYELLDGTTTAKYRDVFDAAALICFYNLRADTSPSAEFEEFARGYSAGLPEKIDLLTAAWNEFKESQEQETRSRLLGLDNRNNAPEAPTPETFDFDSLSDAETAKLNGDVACERAQRLRRQRA